MSKEQEPVILELAPLPREQIGPFLLLGVEKDADQKQIEASWAQRVIWARKNQIAIALADINWAREVINDPERRPRADVTSLNVDTAERVLTQLEEQYGTLIGSGLAWQPLEVEQAWTDYVPDTEVPNARDVQAAIDVPQVPEEVPAVARLLEQWVQEPLDPWALDQRFDFHQDKAV
jgi:hypothetical protein